MRSKNQIGRASSLVLFGLVFVGLVDLKICSANGLEIGAKAPDFQAVDMDGKPISLQSFEAAEVIVIVFTCNECPVAMAYEQRFSEFAKSYEDGRVAFLAINNSTREDVESMQRRVAERELSYSYVYDGSGKSAVDYGAQVTPHCYILDRDRTLIYKGAFDDNWNADPTVSYVSSVVGSLLSGEAPKYTETKAIGCAIKVRR